MLGENGANSHLAPKQRITHTKSRNGCYTCKQRRVKCDELRPTCGACLVRGDGCVYPSLEATRDQRRKQQPRSRERRSIESVPLEACDYKHQVPLRPLNFYLTAPYTVGIQRGSTLNMSDLNLLQHFILHTSKKMTLHKIKTVVWENVIPDMAAANDFLMHLVLALAGVDILTTKGGRRDGTIQAVSGPSTTQLHSIIEHHQQGLAGLQEALCATAEPDAEALLAGSMLLVGFAFASLGIRDLDPSLDVLQGSSHDPPSALDMVPQPLLHIQWLHLVRGVTSILNQFWPTLRTCRLRSLLFFNNGNEDWKLFETELRSGMALNQSVQSNRLRKFAQGANHALLGLREICSTLGHSRSLEGSYSGSPSNITPRSEQSESDGGRTSLSTWDQVITVIEDLYMRILYVLQMRPLSSQSSTSDLDVQIDLEDAAISAWPHHLPEEFISTLDSHGNLDTLLGVNLTILAYLYSTIAILEDIWYLGKMCDGEIYKINTLIQGLGDERLIRLMEWPVDIIES